MPVSAMVFACGSRCHLLLHFFILFHTLVYPTTRSRLLKLFSDQVAHSLRQLEVAAENASGSGKRQWHRKILMTAENVSGSKGSSFV